MLAFVFPAQGGQEVGMGRAVAERWTGSYVSSKTDVVWTDAPGKNVRIAMVTGGTGASTGFALGEEVVASLGS